jgi:hypothetical protein
MTVPTEPGDDRHETRGEHSEEPSLEQLIAESPIHQYFGLEAIHEHLVGRQVPPAAHEAVHRMLIARGRYPKRELTPVESSGLNTLLVDILTPALIDINDRRPPQVLSDICGRAYQAAVNGWILEL